MHGSARGHRSADRLDGPFNRCPQPSDLRGSAALGIVFACPFAVCKRQQQVGGLFTRAAAFITSGMTAVAYFMVHAPKNFMPIVNGGELVGLYCFVFFYLVFAGGGPISLDAMLRKKVSPQR